MIYFFADKDRQEQLRVELESWIGTPYRHWSGVKYYGADCTFYVARVLEAMGLGPFQIPEYAADWHKHTTEEILLDGIKTQLNVEDVSGHQPMNGDIHTFRFGKAVSHIAIYYENHVYHAINDIGVQKIHWLDQKWSRRRTNAFRVIAI